MGYISKTIIPALREITPNGYVDSRLFEPFMWETTTKQCHVHRNTVLDGTWYSDDKLNDFFAIRLQSVFELDHLDIYDNNTKCSNAVDTLQDGSIDQSQCHLFCPNSTPLIFTFWDCVRNSLAHGSSHTNRQMRIMMSQSKSNPTDSTPVKFLLQTKVDIFQALSQLWNEFFDASSRPISSMDYKTMCLTAPLQMTISEGQMYSGLKGKRIEIDEGFSFRKVEQGKKGEKANQLKAYIGSQSFSDPTDIIINDKRNRLGDKSLSVGDVTVIPANQLINYCELTNKIHFIRTPKNNGAKK